MKYFIPILFSVIFCCHGQSQSWRIVSQNNQNSANIELENVWMSPSGNRLLVSVFSDSEITIAGQLHQKSNNYLRLLCEGDTSLFLNAITKTSPYRKRDLSDYEHAIYLSDTIGYLQFVVDSGNDFFGYRPTLIDLTRSVVSFDKKNLISLISDVTLVETFYHSSKLYSNYWFNQDTAFGNTPINLQGAKNGRFYLLAYDKELNPINAFPTSFLGADSSNVGILYGSRRIRDNFILRGTTSKNNGRVFDKSIDDASVLAITDSLLNKKDVFIASKYVTFPYMNYDGDNLYFTCDARPRQAFVVNTAVPNYSFGKIDSSGVLEWVYALPPNASVVQDTAFRTYVFGHLRNDENYFGNSINSLDLYMAVIDPDGSILHFETDSNWFWPNTYFYKLMYSPVTGVNLFMSHGEPVKLGDLVVPNDSGKQNMFLARFKYIEPKDTSSVAIDEELQIFDFQLFPNPVNESIYIKSSEEIKLMRVLNVHGQELSRQEKLQVKETHIDVSDLSPGVYFLQLHSKYGIRSKQFVKE